MVRIMERNIHPVTHPDTLLRLPQVCARIGLSRTSVYALLQRGEFPNPVKIGARAVAFRESDIAEWIDSRPLARGGDQR